MDSSEQAFKSMGDSGVGGTVSLNFDESEDRALGVRFYTDKQISQEKSSKAGVAVYDDVEMCEVRIPGSSDVVRNVVTDKERMRFPRHYQAFLSSKDQDAAVGTPLAMWPIITTSPGSIETARSLGIRTVEQLAQTPDSGVQRLGPGWLDLRKKARAWLLAAKDGAVVNRLNDELAERDRRISALEKLVNELNDALSDRKPAQAAAPPPDVLAGLQAQIAALAAAVSAKPEPKRRGRPPKADTTEA